MKTITNINQISLGDAMLVGRRVYEVDTIEHKEGSLYIIKGEDAYIMFNLEFAKNGHKLILNEDGELEASNWVEQNYCADCNEEIEGNYQYCYNCNRTHNPHS